MISNNPCCHSRVSHPCFLPTGVALLDTDFSFPFSLSRILGGLTGYAIIMTATIKLTKLRYPFSEGCFTPVKFWFILAVVLLFGTSPITALSSLRTSVGGLQLVPGLEEQQQRALDGNGTAPNFSSA